MSISTYSELKAAIASWIHRGDLTTTIPDFITLAEAKFNRRLRTKDMEAALAASTITAGVVAKPSDFLAFKALWNTDEAKTPVEQKSLEYVVSHHTANSVAQYVAWNSTNFHFNSDSGEVQGVYYEEIDALSDSSTTNWLLTSEPGLYLAGALAEAFLYMKDENRMALWEAKANALIDELNGVSQRNEFAGNSLVVRLG
jgi:hypothetical protein